MKSTNVLRPLVPLLWEQRRSFLIFSIFFRLIESLLFAPVAGLTGKAISGHPFIDSTALVSFVLSPRGFAAVTFGAVSVLTIRLVEHAGLALIAWGAIERKRVPPIFALRYVVWRMPLLIRICTRYVVVGFIVVAPVLLIAAFTAKPLLAEHDINYYLAERPAEFIRAAAVIGVVAAICIGFAVWLIVRWRWSAQACLFEGRSVAHGFARSAELTRGVRGRIAFATLVSTLFTALLGIAAAAIGNAFTVGMVRWLDFGTLSVFVLLPLLLTLRAIIGSWATVAGSCVDAGYFTALFHERSREFGGTTAAILLPENIATGGAPSPASRRLTIGALVGVIGFACVAVFVAVDGLRADKPVLISAHRGGTVYAPENSLAAVREAAEAGADYVETDVQMSKDGVLVINHDSDFSRLAGVAQKVWDLTYDEIRALRYAHNTDSKFSNEYIPTLDEFLQESKGKLKVNIELKYYGDHESGMPAKVIDAVRKAGMMDQVLVQCLEYEPLLEIRKLAPEIPIGYLMSVNARKPQRLDVNFLSVEQNRVDGAFVRKAHGRGQQVHLWTVNEAQDIERAFDLGVDGIITDQSALAFELRGKYEALNPAERMARRLKAWLEA